MTTENLSTPLVGKTIPLIKKLFEIQQACPPIYKNAEAKASNKYKWNYATLDEVLAIVRPLFIDRNLFLYWTFDGANLVVHIYDVEADQSLETKLELVVDEGFQDVGKRITYYLNRLILGAIGVIAEEDTGGEYEATRNPRRGSGVDYEDDDDRYNQSHPSDYDEDEEPPRQRQQRSRGRGGRPQYRRSGDEQALPRRNRR